MMIHSNVLFMLTILHLFRYQCTIIILNDNWIAMRIKTTR